MVTKPYRPKTLADSFHFLWQHGFNKFGTWEIGFEQKTMPGGLRFVPLVSLKTHQQTPRFFFRGFLDLKDWTWRNLKFKRCFCLVGR